MPQSNELDLGEDTMVEDAPEGDSGSEGEAEDEAAGPEDGEDNADDAREPPLAPLKDDFMRA